jgi:hypothetical protein
MKYRVLAVRSAGSVCGPAKRYCSQDGRELRFNSPEGAANYAKHMNETCTSVNVEYYPEPIDGRDNTTEGTATIVTKSGIADARVLALKGALSLELKGMKRRGRSAYSIVKEEFGFKGNRQRVYDQLKEYCDEEILRN